MSEDKTSPALLQEALENGPDEMDIADSLAKMSLIGHLEELRRRLILSILAIAAGSVAAFFFAEDIIRYITLPIGKVYYMNPAEAFFTYVKVSVVAGFLLALPIVAYQLWSFILPALSRDERRVSFLLVPISVALFFAGLSFSYILVLPAGMAFFMGFTTDQLQPLISLGQYVSFVISLVLPFGFVFEVPLFVFALARLGVITSAFLIEKRKIMILLAFIIGAVISPTQDIICQTLLAVPLLLLYEASIVIIKYMLHK